ncbi:MAG: thiol-disulfide oxidoreductase DCC family protein [Flavobacteriaceae bacterium]
MMTKAVVLFDGICVLCHFWVRVLCRWDRNNRLQFASLNGEWAKQWEKQNNLSLLSYDSIVVIKENKIYTEDKAVFTLLKTLGGGWKVLLIFSFLPSFLTQKIYRFIAAKRYQWFGKYTECPLPQKKHKHKFL